MACKRIDVRFEESVCFLEIASPGRGSTITDQLVAECSDTLARCERDASIVVLSGAPEVFCLGADLETLANDPAGAVVDPGALYDLWHRMTCGPYVTIAHVRGKAVAGGLGFVAASDIVIADDTARFSLSELLFGLYPACVLPFLIRRIGFQRAHYLTLSTQPISAARAKDWGLVDELDVRSDDLLRRQLLRLRRLSKTAIAGYKGYAQQLASALPELRTLAVNANREVFSRPENRRAIERYVRQGLFPWEEGRSASLNAEDPR